MTFKNQLFNGNKLGVKFESTNNSWRTPKSLFEPLNKEFHFDYDLACSEENKLCEKGFTEEQDAFKQTWLGIGYLNPPFGLKKYPLKKWIGWCHEQTQTDERIIVAVIPARTNTNWWHQYVMKSKEVRFIKGRPKFIGNIHGLPQPLTVIIFANHSEPTKYTTFDFQNTTD